MLRNKFRYLMLLAIVGLLLILFNQYYIGMIFLTIIMMPFFLFGLISYTYGRIRAELVLVVHVTGKGDKIPITIQLNNPTIFPIGYMKINILYKNAYSKHKFRKIICTSMDSRTKTSVIFHLSSVYAGNMEIALESIRIYDPMKLFSLKRRLTDHIKVAVLPSCHSFELSDIIDRNIFLEDRDTYSAMKKGDDPSEVFEIRTYREGDRLPRIHWKLSIKQQQLMIKEFSDPVTSRELLFINLNICEESKTIINMDRILECALSFSFSLIEKGYQLYLAWYDKEFAICTRVQICREQDLFEAVDDLLHAKPYIPAMDALSVYLSEYPHDHYCNMYFISTIATVPKVDSFLDVKAHNRRIIYVPEKGAEAEEQVLMNSYPMAGIEVWKMNIGEDIVSAMTNDGEEQFQ